MRNVDSGRLGMQLQNINHRRAESSFILRPWVEPRDDPKDVIYSDTK